MRAAKALAGLAAMGIAGAAAPCQAETTKSFLVSAAVVNGCVVTSSAGSWGTINFGTVSGLATGTLDADLVLSGASGLRIECTPSTSINLTADNGDNAASGQRQLAKSGVATKVPYALYADGSATPWTGQAIPISFSAGTAVKSVPIKGRATLPGTLPAGKYTDTVRITVTW